MQTSGVSNSNEAVVAAVVVTVVAAVPALLLLDCSSLSGPAQAPQPRLKDSGGVHPNAHSVRLRRSQQAISCCGSSPFGEGLFSCTVGGEWPLEEPPGRTPQCLRYFQCDAHYPLARNPHDYLTDPFSWYGVCGRKGTVALVKMARDSEWGSRWINCEMEAMKIIKGLEPHILT